MKKVVLISTFCDTQKKIDYLRSNLIKINELGLDSIIISPIELPFDIVNLTTHCIFTKYNPVIDWPEHAMSMWETHQTSYGVIKLSRTVADYGFSGLWHVKCLSEYALVYDYDRFYHIIYDTVIDETVKSCFLADDKVANVYPSTRDNDVWKVGLHLMAFDRENIKKLADSITKESYMLNIHSRNGNSDAFTWLENNPVKTIPCVIEETVVKDHIYYFDNTNLFNYSDSSDFNLFIQKCDLYEYPIKFIFFNNTKSPLSIEIMKNDQIILVDVYDDYLIEIASSKDCRTISNLSIEYKNQSFDLTDTFMNIKNNLITIVDDKIKN